MVVGLLTLGQKEAGEALINVVSPQNLLFPVAHVDLYHLQQLNKENISIGYIHADLTVDNDRSDHLLALTLK